MYLGFFKECHKPALYCSKIKKLNQKTVMLHNTSNLLAYYLNIGIKKTLKYNAIYEILDKYSFSFYSKLLEFVPQINATHSVQIAIKCRYFCYK